MKQLKDILNEGILGDIESKMNNDDIKDVIREWLKENYFSKTGFAVSAKPNKDGKYEVTSSSDIIAKNKELTSLTNGMFVFGKVYGDFVCSNCHALTSLKDGPKDVTGSFKCDWCYSLESLEHSPTKVGKVFSCQSCNKLTSLKGSPKKAEVFNCSYCYYIVNLKGGPKEVKHLMCCNCKNLRTLEGCPKISGYLRAYSNKYLESLKGCPEKIHGDFVIDNNPALMSLEYAPKYVGETFVCNKCGGEFKKSDVMSVCKVDAEIIC